ncbi:MAG: hypothetical protein Q7T40_11400 [Methylobacter sp.]|nr:hypothetical protein [Methylobacter sp.]
MKVTKTFSPMLLIAAALFTNTAYAYDPGETEVACKKPQFRDFSLPVYSEPEKTEVAPEAAFSFTLSPWTDPNTIQLTAKKQNIDFTVESNSSFHRVNAKLPAAFAGNFVRINSSAKAVLGCSDKIGWLIKVADQ